MKTLRNAALDVVYSCLRAGITPMRFGSIERYREKQYLKQMLDRLGADLVLDVGANNGTYGQRLRMMGYRGEIVSFEPIPHEFAKIVAKQQHDPLWSARQLALGSESCRKEFNIIEAQNQKTVYSSFLQPDGAPPVSKVQTVEVRRLDEMLPGILKGRNPRIFLKSDTQGFDLEVIRGIGDQIGRFVGIQVEMSVTPIYRGMPHYTESLSYLESLGFSLMDLRVIDRTDKDSVLEYDCFMARLDALR